MVANHIAMHRKTPYRWVKQTIHDAGVPEVFTAHSTRAASTSAKLISGIDLNDILKCAGWSQSSTFHRFYNKTLMSGLAT